MALKFKTGDQVQQLVTPIRGVVKAAQVVDGTHVQYLVEHINAEGNSQVVWLHEDNLGADTKIDGAAV